MTCYTYLAFIRNINIFMQLCYLLNMTKETPLFKPIIALRYVTITHNLFTHLLKPIQYLFAEMVIGF